MSAVDLSHEEMSNQESKVTDTIMTKCFSNKEEDYVFVGNNFNGTIIKAWFHVNKVTWC